MADDAGFSVALARDLHAVEQALDVYGMTRHEMIERRLHAVVFCQLAEYVGRIALRVHRNRDHPQALALLGESSAIAALV